VLLASFPALVGFTIAVGRIWQGGVITGAGFRNAVAGYLIAQLFMISIAIGAVMGASEGLYGGWNPVAVVCWAVGVIYSLIVQSTYVLIPPVSTMVLSGILYFVLMKTVGRQYLEKKRKPINIECSMLNAQLMINLKYRLVNYTTGFRARAFRPVSGSTPPWR